jgi:hypothetical protein
MVSGNSIDFGLSDCGGAATPSSITLQDSGGAPLTWSAALTGDPAFVLTAPSSPSGTLNPGDMVTLTVTATVPSSAIAAAILMGSLAITTNDAQNATITIPVTATAQGATLTLSPTTASFGVQPVGTTTPDTPITLTNTGNAMAMVDLAQPGDSQFAIDWTGSPAGVSLAPSASVPGLVGRFTPMVITPSNTMAAITVTGAVCGANSVTAIPLTGQGTNGVITLSSMDLFFGAGGMVDCGTTGSALALTLGNAGNATYNWNAALGKGASSPFTIDSPGPAVSSGNVLRGGSHSITVTPKAIPDFTQSPPTATDAFSDTLEITTDIAGDAPHFVHLHMTAHGAVLAFLPTQFDFGNVPIDTTSTAPFDVVNTGSGDATVTLSSDGNAFAAAPADMSTPPTLVSAGGFTLFDASFAPGASTATQTANISLMVQTTDVLCAPLPGDTTNNGPPVLALQGTGTSSSVAFKPAALSFGNVSCNTTAAAQTLTFTNAGNADYTLMTETLGKGTSSPYGITLNPASGLVSAAVCTNPTGATTCSTACMMAGGCSQSACGSICKVTPGSLVITVTPTRIPAVSAVTNNLYGDTLTVTTNATGDNPHNIPLNMTASGSIFTISTNSLDFGSVVVGSTGNSSFSVDNQGNADGTLTFSPTNGVFLMPGCSQSTSCPAALTVSANSAANPTATYTPTATGGASDTATIAASGSTVLCQPLPFTTMSLSGSGTNANVVQLSSSSVTFGSGGLVDCGTAATAKVVNITSTASATLNMTYTLAGGSNSPYMVSGDATIAAGGMGMVTITPKTIPIANTTSVAADGFADTLTITAMNATVNESHDVALHETAQGAILSFNPTSLGMATSFGSLCAKDSKGFTVDNAGNINAAYTLSLTSGAANFTVSPAAGSVGGSNGSANESVTFSPSSCPLGHTVDSGSIGVATSAVICHPLPSDLGLTGTIN